MMIHLITATSTIVITLIYAAIRFPDSMHKSSSNTEDGQWRGIKQKRDGRVNCISSKAKGCLLGIINAMTMKLLTDSSVVEKIEDKLTRSRMIENMTAAEYTSRRLSIIFIFVALNTLVSVFTPYSLSIPNLIILIALVFYVPDHFLEQRAKVYESAVSRELPQTIEMLLICSESGMGLVSAIKIVSERKGGIIGQELQICLQEIALGVRIQEALRNFSKRNKSREVLLFTNSIVQALRMGTPINGVLRNLTNSIRENERQRLDNIIGSIPMKLTIVTMLFFMPIIFIIVLFPSLLSFMKSGW